MGFLYGLPDHGLVAEHGESQWGLLELDESLRVARMAGRTEEKQMTPSQLQACSKLLGEPWWIDGGTSRISRAELFYALLLKLAECNKHPMIEHVEAGSQGKRGWYVYIYALEGSTGTVFGSTPLDALAAAIEKLEDKS